MHAAYAWDRTHGHAPIVVLAINGADSVLLVPGFAEMVPVPRLESGLGNLERHLMF